MCDPLSMIGFAIGAVQSVVQYQADVFAAEQQNRMYQENAARAQRAAHDQMFQTQQRMLQEQASAGEEKIDNMREARKARATAEVAAGEANVSGLSVNALLKEFSQQESRYNDRIDQNTEWTLDQLQDEIRGIQSNAEDRINSVQRAAKPSFFNTGLSIAAKGFDAINTYQDNQQKYKFNRR